MKKIILGSVVFLITTFISGQKLVNVGKKSFVIRGEKIIGYDEIGLYGTETNWVEVYLFVSTDSIIVTELQSKTSKSEVYDMAFFSRAKKSDLDLENITSSKHDLVKSPTNLLKVEIITKGQKEIVTAEAWQGEKSLGVISVDGIRIIVKDDKQANAVIKKLQTK
jgi:hypothetical protein